ncbi:hypothetical protein [Sphingobacterium corticibacter]|uniref:Uncharacterized protein n=1 Tax=Sphingobacterium corticibacter TaxID=2171749 RepID=A0A2T8HK03_9SPHI|nr:hypothetical protein [Sphingobacterium corticibacter]PVH25769.1 hypothetical protein DC487_07490 [Sphingobacterium corticibacter]
MKTSHILFASTLALLLLVACVPQLVGLIKYNHENKPADFMSRFWAEHFNRDQGEKVLERFHYIHVDGQDKRISLHVNKSQSDTVKAWNVSTKDLKMEVKNDTLYLKQLNKDGFYLILDVPNPIRDLTVNQSKLSASIAEDLMNDMQLNILGGSDLTLGPPYRGEEDTIQRVIPNLRFVISGKSRAFIDNYSVEQVNANLQDGLLRYSQNLKVDTMTVKLVGKSNVSSIRYDENNQIGLLNVSGDQKYFRKEFVGQNVHLNLTN